MSRAADEWFKQADYDLGVARYMFEGDRRSYAVFMAHLAVEKGLKGLFQERTESVPPRTHNLVYLAERAGLEVPDELLDALATLNQMSVPTRYPEELDALLRQFTPERTDVLLQQAARLLLWLKSKRSNLPSAS